jgi:hypothetical protein
MQARPQPDSANPDELVISDYQGLRRLRNPNAECSVWPRPCGLIRLARGGSGDGAAPVPAPKPPWLDVLEGSLRASEPRLDGPWTCPDRPISGGGIRPPPSSPRLG